jgi:hypothetical protein
MGFDEAYQPFGMLRPETYYLYYKIMHPTEMSSFLCVPPVVSRPILRVRREAVPNKSHHNKKARRTRLLAFGNDLLGASTLGTDLP